jgi:6-pyruvoyltetrahydropterin/6-carboxytetrahydropterin synthase
MYSLKTEHSFDSAHFLAGYEGKCKNIHGHRWRVEIEIKSKALMKEGQLEGMVVDFDSLKTAVKTMIDGYDHALIIQEGTMREETLKCLLEDEFHIIMVNFRPTAENFAVHFFKTMKAKGFDVKKATVYETPTNSAAYEESEMNESGL